jgi:hypothetical protein
LWWREAWSIRFDVGYFRGISLGLWLRVLHENHFAIDSPYWGRAGATTLGSIPNTPAAEGDDDPTPESSSAVPGRWLMREPGEFVSVCIREVNLAL